MAALFLLLLSGVTKVSLTRMSQKQRNLWLILEKNKVNPTPNIIRGEAVEIVDLGTVFDSHLNFDINTETIAKRGHQRIHLLRKINYFLCTVSLSYIESSLSFSFIS